MKKLFALLTILLLALSACAPVQESSQPAAEESGSEESMNIVVSIKGPGGGNPFWAAVEAGAMEKGEELGVNVTVVAPPTESDVASQISQIEDQLANLYRHQRQYGGCDLYRYRQLGWCRASCTTYL